MQMITFILSSGALTWILLRSPLFKRIRESITDKYQSASSMYKMESSVTSRTEYLIYWILSNLFGCPGCMGFWSGVIIFSLGLILPDLIFSILQHGLIGAVTSLFIIQINIKLQ